MGELPIITVYTGTLNANLNVFKQSLESLKYQNYPKNHIEHIVMDGGSTNGTVDLAKKYNCKIIIRKDLQDESSNAQARPALAYLRAKGELILVLESDNILPSKYWLMQMVQPFVENKKIFCTYSAYNTYKKNMSLTTRYSALFGTPEPTLYYLHKTEKIRMDQVEYNKGEIIKRTNKYDVVKFNKNNLPTLGDNGHMFLKKAMVKVIKNPEDYTHTDAFMQMFELGYDTFGVVKNSIIHTMNPKIFSLVKRRVDVKKVFYDGRRGKRKYLVYNPNSIQDKINLFKYIIFSITFIVPFFEALRGYMKIREKAWFLHPVMCFLMVVGYGVSEIQWFVKKRFKLL